MNRRFKRISLLLLAALLLAGLSRIQDSMNRDRERLGLTRVEPLDNAPPILAFTTVALGGFRGLISNFLWMRATKLQDESKYFEMVQLADWITKLEPHYTKVWAFEAWNMGWNISVKFKDFSDRWRWLSRGMQLLRDEALRYNPDDLDLYNELSWIFHDKMGAVTDDASYYYKEQWAKDMSQVFLHEPPDFDALIHPKTADERKRAELLRQKYKIDPAFLKKVDERYGPLDWRLPEAHAIYWAAMGLHVARENPRRVKKDDLIKLHRAIYQSMLLSFERGRLEQTPFGIQFGPNLAIIPKVNEAYENNMGEDPKYWSNIRDAHRNFLLDAIYTLYVNHHIAEALKWYRYLGRKFPNKTIINGDPNSFPRNVSLRDFAVSQVQQDLNETSPHRMKAALEGLLTRSYICLVQDQNQRALGYKNLAQQAYNSYVSKITGTRVQAMSIGSFQSIDKGVLDRLLDPQHGAPPDIRAMLRSKLGLPAETAPAKSKKPAPAPAPAPAASG